MSRIDELVERLCPDGVEYRALGEVADYVRMRVAASSLEPGSYVGVNELLPDYRGRSDEVRLPAEESCIAFEPGDILLGNIRPYLKKLWLADSLGGTNGDVLVIRVNDPDIVSPAFLREVLMGEGFTSYNVQNSKGAKMPRGDKKAILQFRIPIPPLEVQEEIVRVLDSFAELEVALEIALEAELEARGLQYAHYRDQLLDFREREDVSWLTLGEVFETRNGYTPSKKKPQYWQDGTVPWFRMEDIRENGRVLDTALQQVNTCALKSGGAFPANSLIIATTATIGEHALITVDFLCNQRFTCLMLKDEYRGLLDVKFLFYYCFVLDEWCKANTRNSSFASVDMQGFAKFRIPVPSLAEQQRIVSILDRFDALTTSLTDGLPAEIEARRQQCAYWRDRLLDFPAKPAA